MIPFSGVVTSDIRSENSESSRGLLESPIIATARNHDRNDLTTQQSMDVREKMRELLFAYGGRAGNEPLGFVDDNNEDDKE
jgi:hypothetical protein